MIGIFVFEYNTGAYIFDINILRLKFWQPPFQKEAQKLAIHQCLWSNWWWPLYLTAQYIIFLFTCRLVECVSGRPRVGPQQQKRSGGTMTTVRLLDECGFGSYKKKKKEEEPMTTVLSDIFAFEIDYLHWHWPFCTCDWPFFCRSYKRNIQKVWNNYKKPGLWRHTNVSGFVRLKNWLTFLHLWFTYLHQHICMVSMKWKEKECE